MCAPGMRSGPSCRFYLLALAVVLLPAVSVSLYNSQLLVSDVDTHAVLRFSSSGEFLGEFVKRRSGGLTQPGGLAAWSTTSMFSTPDVNTTRGGGNLYVASTGSNQILQYNGINGRFERCTCKVPSPQDLAILDGVLYVSSSATHTIHRFRASTGSSLGKLASGMPLQGPRGMQIMGDTTLLVGSYYSGHVLAYDTQRSWSCPLTQSPCSAPPHSLTSVKLGSVTSMAIGAESIYVVGPRLGAIFRLNATTGQYIDHFEDEALQEPMGIEVLNGHLFVTLAKPGVVQRYNALTGESYGSFAIVPHAMSRPNQLLWY